MWILDKPRCLVNTGTFPKLKEARLDANRYLGLHSSISSCNSKTLSDLKNIASLEITNVVYLCEDKDSWIQELGLESCHESINHLNKHSAVIVAKLNAIDRLLEDLAGDKYLLILLGEYDEDLQYDIYGCLACISTKQSFRSSLERLLYRQIMLFIRRLGHSLNYNAQPNRLRGELIKISFEKQMLG